jgi:hypothetical protein
MRRLLQLVFVLAALTWGTLLWRSMGGMESREEGWVRTAAVAVLFVSGFRLSAREQSKP